MPESNFQSGLRTKLIALTSIIGFTAVTAALGGWGSRQAPTFYAALDQPFWAPPAWLFGPVWAILYSLMGFTAFLIWRKVRTLSHRILKVYFLQLILNGLWSFLFFSWQWGALALLDITLLLALILALIRETALISPRISLLWGPYALWVLFAGILNLTLWQTNPDALGAFTASVHS